MRIPRQGLGHACWQERAWRLQRGRAVVASRASTKILRLAVSGGQGSEFGLGWGLGMARGLLVQGALRF